MTIYGKIKLWLVMGSMVLGISCTGCAGLTLDDMRTEGKELLEQGAQVNRKIVTDAVDTNQQVLNGEKGLDSGWKKVFEKEDLRIQYASPQRLDEKGTIESVEEFLEMAVPEQWQRTSEFPVKDEVELIFFVQQKITTKKSEEKYKNIANIRVFPEEKYVAITVAKGLIDLSEEFELNNNEFSTIYLVPEETVEYLTNFVER